MMFIEIKGLVNDLFQFPIKIIFYNRYKEYSVIIFVVGFFFGDSFIFITFFKIVLKVKELSFLRLSFKIFFDH